MKIPLPPNEVRTGQYVQGKRVTIVDPSEGVTILHFADGSKLPLANTATVEVEEKASSLTLESETE